MESNNFIKSFIIFLSCHFLGTPKRKDKKKIRRKRKKKKEKKNEAKSKKKNTISIWER